MGRGRSSGPQIVVYICPLSSETAGDEFGFRSCLDQQSWKDWVGLYNDAVRWNSDMRAKAVKEMGQSSALKLSVNPRTDGDEAWSRGMARNPKSSRVSLRAGGACLRGILGLSTLPMFAQAAKAGVPDITGVYEAVPNNETVPGGLKNSGSPQDIGVQPEAAAKAKTADLKQDNAKGCQAIGPFRMMARPGILIDVLPSVKTDRVYIAFEDYFLGLVRQFLLNRGHDPKLPPTYNGNSVARWEKDTLVVDTTNFNEWLWLNDNGVQPSKDLHLTERIRPVGGGEYLEVKMTADDAKVLNKTVHLHQVFQKGEQRDPGVHLHGRSITAGDPQAGPLTAGLVPPKCLRAYL